MAKAIALQETGGTHYWDGGNVGIAHHKRYPLVEKLANGQMGTGYGVMQLDVASGLVNRDTIWNWKKNIDSAMAHIKADYDAGVQYLNQHPDGPPQVNDVMKRLEGYCRYNGGINSRYHWWNVGGCNIPAGCGAAPAVGWVKFGYVVCPGGGTKGFRDYNNDGQTDCDGNPFCVPNAQWAPANTCVNRAERYADSVIQLEP